MKIIVTGGTGFVGSQVLTQLSGRADVTGVTALSRRALPELPKVETLLHQDFAEYDDALAALLAAHDGCVWALGGKVSDADDAGAYERATVTFTMQFARAVATHLTNSFRFCYLSGMGADPTESAWLPWEKTTRHLKGRAERQLEALTREHPLFRATAFRPAGILPVGTSGVLAAVLAPIAVRVEQVGTAMIDEVVGARSAPFRVVSNRAMRAPQ